MRKIGWISLTLGIVGCRGTSFEQPPVHLNQNMDQQMRHDPQESESLFSDGRAMRSLVAGTVARGYLREDDHVYRGKIDGKLALRLPPSIPITRDLLERGKVRFGIYCAVCHGEAGFGDGMVVQRGMFPPPSFHETRLVTEPVGYFYDVVTNGIRNMPAYKGRILDVRDRWAIAAYVRALQLSQLAKLSQVPRDIAAQRGWK